MKKELTPENMKFLELELSLVRRAERICKQYKYTGESTQIEEYNKLIHESIVNIQRMADDIVREWEKQ